MIKVLRTTLEKQINNKIIEKENLKRLKTEEREFVGQIEKNHREKTKEDSFSKKLKVMNFKKILDEQILNKKNPDFMSLNEKKFNSVILKLSGEK